MSDVFLSYAREDRATAEKIASMLVPKGISVFWDRNIGSGEMWDEVLGRELKAARCVIVLWSQHSIASRWVKSEASEAAERSILLPVLIDQVEIPFQFKLIQTVDLIAWDGSEDDDAILSLVAGISRYKATGEQPQLPTSSKAARFRRNWGRVVSYCIAVLLLLAISAFTLNRVAQRKGWFTRTVPYHIFLESGEGLSVGDSVLLTGRPIGKITQLETTPPFESRGNIFVAFDVLDPYFGYIWTDSRVNVQWHPSKQRRYIHVMPGGSSLKTNTNAVLNPTYKLQDGKLVGRDEKTGTYIPIGKDGAMKYGYHLPAEETAAQ